MTKSTFTIYNIIQKKRDKGKLTKEEITWFVQGLTEGRIEDYQASALLMAIFLNGLDKNETIALTDAMLYSGKVLDFDQPIFVDKHSTGGVGDKIGDLPLDQYAGERLLDYRADIFGELRYRIYVLLIFYHKSAHPPPGRL